MGLSLGLSWGGGWWFGVVFGVVLGCPGVVWCCLWGSLELSGVGFGLVFGVNVGLSLVWFRVVLGWHRDCLWWW